MSNKDKTRNKLMETMRMTKADCTNKLNEVDEADTPIQKKKKKTTMKKVSKGTPKSSADPYQTVRRVWPD